MKRRLIRGLLPAFGMALLCFALGRFAPAQESSQSPDSQQQSVEPSKPHTGLGGEVVHETKEVDSTEHLKKSPSVAWIARTTGLSLEGAYWLAVVLNFAILFGTIFWAARKFLPGIFRDRTASIQKAMEDARRTSEDANRRLTDIESRLAKLGDEIANMKVAGEADIAAEEARVKAAAEEDAKKIVEAAEQEIAAAAKTARRDLTAYAADLAVSLAKRQIRVDPSTDEGLVRSFAERLGVEGSKN